MKNGFLKWLRKYWLCLLLSALMAIGFALSLLYNDLSVRDHDVFTLGLWGIYLILVAPPYSFLYGCLSYAKTKKVWVPQLFLFTTTCMYFLCQDLILHEGLDDWKSTFIYAAVLVVFSLVGTLIAAFIHKVTKSVKENKNQEP